MPLVMKVMGLADGHATKLDGQWLETWDTGGGDRQIEQQGFTDDISKAMRFADLVEGTEMWKRTSTLWPRRPDGEPNRPLTALNVMFEPAPDA